MEKWNVKDENGENLVIVIKLELEEKRNDDKTVDSNEVLYTEEERSETQIEKTDTQRDTSLENESIVDLFWDAFKEIPNSESSQKAAEEPVWAERERKKEPRFNGSEQSLDNAEDNLVKCSAKVVDENSQSGTIFNYAPNLSTTPQVAEPKTAGIEAGNGPCETNWNETMGISGKESLTNKCQKCLKDFANKTFLLLHIDDKHPEVRNPRPLPCEFCDDIFTIKPRLVSHIKNVHGKSYGLRLREREITDRDENVGVCRWCGKEYKQERALRNHERLHTGETPYNCKLCGNSFELKLRLDAHVRSRHKVTVLDEPVVPEEMPISGKKSENYVKDVNGYLNNGSSFKMEAKNQDRQRRETDTVENVTTDYLKSEQNVIFDGDDSTNIVKIEKVYIGDPPYICDYEGCKEAFKIYPALEAHLKNHTAERPFCCYREDCEKSFTTNLKLKVHERIHKKELPFACDWEGCGQKFALSAHCKRHFMTHTREKPHVCNACQKRFSRSDHMKKHVTWCVTKSVVKNVEKSRKDRQKRNENVITENLTQKRNAKKSSSNMGVLTSLLGHVASKVSCRCAHCQKIESIKGHGNHVCDYEDCSKSFKREKELKNHLGRWHKEQIFVCNFESCSEKFENYTKLRIHFVTHIGDPPYVCNYEECGKSFQVYPALKDHMKKHTGNRPRPYSCFHEGCGKSFARNQKLTVHMRSHTGEKPHICNECNKGFSQAHHLKNHQRTHTGEKPYVCRKCNKGFSRTHHLKKHTTGCVET